MKTPVILIPGIQGTKLSNVNRKNFDTVWSALRKFYDNLYDLFLQPDGISDKSENIIIERSDIEDLAYSEIINFFNDRGTIVYIFGYDWRKSNLISGEKLAKFIEHLQKKLGIKKFNFITHSMGALVLSAYFKILGGCDKIDDVVNKAIFTVPPFLGSAEAIFNLLIGKSKLFNTSDDFRKIARTFPSIFELCPLYDGAIEFENQGGQEFNLFNYKHWQQDKSHINKEKKKEIFTKRLNHLKKVRNDKKFIYDLSKLPDNILSRLLIVAGTNSSTLRKITVSRHALENPDVTNFFKFDHEDKNGDGTVHMDSACVFKKAIKTLAVESNWFETRSISHFIQHDWHAFFLNSSRIQNILKRFFEFEQDKLDKEVWYNSIGGEIERIQ